MKKKNTPFTCLHCQREFNTLRGIRIHYSQMHPNAGPFETTITVEKQKRSEQPNPDWRAPSDLQEVDGPIVNFSSPPPFHYAILTEFDEAVRHHEMKGSCNPDEWDAIEQNYARAKRLLAVRILVLKTRADLCDVLEREIMS
jgi:hypothetical protein